MMTDRKHIFGAVAALICVAILGTLTLAWPSYRQGMAIGQEIEELREKTQMLDASAAEVELLEMRLHEVQRQVNEDLKVIADSPDLADLVRRLSLTVDHETVIDQTFTAGSPYALSLPAIDDGGSKPMAMPVTIELAGTFESLYAILTAAEDMDRLIRIGTLRITCERSVTNDGRPLPVLNASVGLEAVFTERAAAQ